MSPPLAELHGRLLQREEVDLIVAGPDIGNARTPTTRQDQRRRLRRRRGRGRGLLVQPGRRHRPAVPDRPAARADHQRAVRQRRTTPRPRASTSRPRPSSTCPSTSSWTSRVEVTHVLKYDLHTVRRAEVRRHAGPVRTVVGQRHAGLARQLAEHAVEWRPLHPVGHRLLCRQDQVGGSTSAPHRLRHRQPVQHRQRRDG
jgi:hypothetical protein